VQRSISWQAHVRMMAAAQPFLSGAISKTVNMPRESTPEDIAGAYIEGWKLGLKALAIYRDGSKESQPLSTSTETAKKSRTDATPAPRRERLPDTRRSVTHKFSVAGHEGYITVGLYDDGRPGELFITMAKEGSTIGGLMDAFGTAVSIALQYGVPLELLVRKFSYMRFEPMGHTPNPDIRIASSVVDYIFRWLGMTFLPGYREAMLGARAAAESASGKGSASPAPASEDPAAGPPRGPASPSGAQGPAGSVGSAAQAVRGSGHSNGTPGSNGTDLEHWLHRSGVAAALPGEKFALQNEQFAHFQADAPPCDLCGNITVRNGNCYLCHVCGNSMGCS
jgi:ribonucleoside-diphosphate reductase alpha chain